MVQWTSNLPPLPIVFGADGELINLEDSFDPVSSEPRKSQTTNSDLSESEPSESTGMGIESTEPDAKSNEAIVGDNDEHSFSTESPTMEEIEDAWESNREWESQDSNSESVSQTLQPRDLDLVDDEDSSSNEESRFLEPKETSTLDQNRRNVSTDDDQQSYFERGASRRRPRNLTRFLKLVAPTLVVVSSIAAILIYSGIDLGFYPLDGASNSVAGTVMQTPEKFGRTATESIAGREFAADASGFDRQTDQKAVDSAAPPRQSSYQNPVLTNVEDLILSLDGRGQEKQANTADTEGVTIETIARRQLEQRNTEKQPEARESLSNELNRSLLVFPATPPSADSIRQAAARPAIERHELEIPEEVSGDWTETIPHVAEPSVSNDPSSETASAISDLTVAESITPVESTDLIRACDRATTSLEKLKQAKELDVPPAVRLRAELTAFRDLSRVGSLLTEPESPRVDAVFSVMLQSETLSQLAPLCHEWIGWKRRATDGMLVIGTIREKDGKTTVELADGSRIDLEVSHPQTMPIGTQSAMLGRIISINGRPLIRLASAIAVPSPG